MEIDYEENSGADLAGLQAFIDAYRAALPLRRVRRQPGARLTIDTAAGDRWLIDINRKATADSLRTDAPVLDYANAMVPARQPSTSSAIANWQEHIDGKPQFAPRSRRWRRRSSPVASTSPKAGRSAPSATTSPPPCRT